MGAFREMLKDMAKSAAPINISGDKVEVDCPRCGKVEVREDEVATGWAMGETFDCPKCGRTVATNSNADYRDRNIPGK